MWWTCKHRETDMITRIGRDQSPYVLRYYCCKSCGKRVPPSQAQALSGEAMYALLKRAEALPEGADEIISTAPAASPSPP
jgi:hypothetical protein